MSSQEQYEQAVRAVRDSADLLDKGVDIKLYPLGQSWKVWVLGGTPYPRALLILPAPDGDEADIERGISTAVVRKIPLGEIVEDAKADMPMVLAMETRAALRRLSDAVEAGGRDDLYYAVVADAYEGVTLQGDKNPIETLALVAGIHADTMRTHVREARSRGLLTGTPGRSGGRVTEKGRELLREGEG